MIRMLSLLFLGVVTVVLSFAPPKDSPANPISLRMAKEQESPLLKTIREVGNMFSNFDDIVDDFFNKRMGNGEIFYGKRKYKPSGKVDGVYNGMGLSDKQRIDDTREYRDFILEQRRLREEFEKRKREDKD